MAGSEPVKYWEDEIMGGQYEAAAKYLALENERLTALLAERDAEIVRLVDAGQAYIDAYDAALKALPHDERAEERCHTERYNLRAALAARGEGEF